MEAVNGTRWGRALPAMVVGLALVVSTLGMLQAQVLALNFTVSDTSGEFASTGIRGEDVGFGMAEMTTRNGQTRKVLRAGFASGSMNGFCYSRTETIPIVGSVFFKLTAGDGDPSTYEISANNAVFDIQELKGSGTGVNLDGVVQLGLATQDITTLPGVDNPLDQMGTGYFGIDATKGDLHQVRGTLWNADITGNITLPKLGITVSPSGTGCKTGSLPQ